NYDWQVAQLTEQRHSRKGQGVSHSGLESANAALAKYHLVVAMRCDVFGRKQKLFYSRTHPALEKHRLSHAAKSLEQREVLHVSRADLKYVCVFGHYLSVFSRHDFSDDLQPRALASFGQQ